MNAVMIYYLYANAPAGLGFDKADAAQLISLYATVSRLLILSSSTQARRQKSTRKRKYFVCFHHLSVTPLHF